MDSLLRSPLPYGLSWFLLSCNAPTVPGVVPNTVPTAATAPETPKPDAFPRSFDDIPVQAPKDFHPVPTEGEGDYDEDGKMDRYRLEYDGGSGYGTTTLHLHLGSGKEWTLSHGGSFGDRTAWIPTPFQTMPMLANLGWFFFGTMEFVDLDDTRVEGLVPGKADPALLWVYDHLALPSLPVSAPLVNGGAWTPHWESGPPTPSTFQLSVIRHLHGAREMGLLAVSNWGLDHLEAAGTCGAYQLYVAPHGVAAWDPKRDRSTWIWISGVPGISEVQKLRWRSVRRIDCHEDLVEVEVSEHGRIFIDPSHARWAELPEGEEVDLPKIRRTLGPQEWDLDGDGRTDSVDWRFTGGAHCCYEPTVNLSASKAVKLPISLDGGMVFDSPWGGAPTKDVHGTCGPNFEEHPRDRCEVVALHGRPALLLHGVEGEWRAWRFLPGGRNIAQDWGSDP